MGSLRPGPRDAGDVQLGGSHASWGGECVLGGLVCYDYGLDEGSVQNVAAALFVGLVVAWAVAIFASYASRRGARSDMGYYFSAGCLLGLVCVQWYYVFLAANHAPPSVMPAHTRRYDCERSRKGGKRSTVDRLNPPGGTVNPCFCHPYARCVDHATGRVYHAGDGTPAAVPCTADGSAYCQELDGRFVPHWIHYCLGTQPTDRDCRHGRGAACSARDPCTPCEVEGRRAGPPRGLLLGLHGRRPGQVPFHAGRRALLQGWARRRQAVRDVLHGAAPGHRRLARLGGARRRGERLPDGQAVAYVRHRSGGHRSQEDARRDVRARGRRGAGPGGGPAGAGRVRDGPVDARRRDGAAAPARADQDRARVVRGPHGPDRSQPGNATAAIAACAGAPATPAPAPSPEPTPGPRDLDRDRWQAQPYILRELIVVPTNGRRRVSPTSAGVGSATLDRMVNLDTSRGRNARREGKRRPAGAHVSTSHSISPWRSDRRARASRPGVRAAPRRRLGDAAVGRAEHGRAAT